MPQFLKENQSVVLAVSSIVIVLAILLIFMSRKSGASSFQNKWMYDLKEQSLVKAPANWSAPASSDSGDYDYGRPLGLGSALVDAIVVICGDASAKDIRPGMTADELKGVDARIAILSRGPNPLPETGQQKGSSMGNSDWVSKPGLSEWYPVISPVGAQFRDQSIRSACGEGERGQVVLP